MERAVVTTSLFSGVSCGMFAMIRIVLGQTNMNHPLLNWRLRAGHFIQGRPERLPPAPSHLINTFSWPSPTSSLIVDRSCGGNTFVFEFLRQTVILSPFIVLVIFVADCFVWNSRHGTRIVVSWLTIKLNSLGQNYMGTAMFQHRCRKSLLSLWYLYVSVPFHTNACNHRFSLFFNGFHSLQDHARNHWFSQIFDRYTKAQTPMLKS